MKCKLNIFPPKYIVCITCLFLVGILCLTSCDNIPNVIEMIDKAYKEDVVNGTIQ